MLPDTNLAQYATDQHSNNIYMRLYMQPNTDCTKDCKFEQILFYFIVNTT